MICPNLDAYAYARVSGLTQADTEKDGLPRQDAAIRAFAVREGYNVVQTFFDAHTGTELDRPAFLDMRRLLVAGPVKVVIVESLSRLARLLMLQESAIEDFKRNGWELISITEPGLNSDDPGRVAMRQMLGVFSQYEKSVLVARMKAGKARARAQGKVFGGRARYGAHKQHPGERAVMDRVFHLRRMGMNAAKIAEVLNAEKVCTRSGGLWYPMQVSRILSQTQQITQEKQS